MSKAYPPPSLLRALCLLGLVCLGACADGSGTLRTLDARQAAGLEPRTYRLGIGDKIKLVVFGEADLSGTFEVNASGQIVLPLAGDVVAKGATMGELKDRIAGRLAQGYLRNPKVSVEVQTYRPIFVHGEVRNGGEFVYKNGIKLRDAIAAAGGYTYRANQGYVLLTREGALEEVRVNLPTSILVMPGDNIRVPERFF